MFSSLIITLRENINFTTHTKKTPQKLQATITNAFMIPFMNIILCLEFNYQREISP